MTARVASFWMREYSIARSVRETSAAMIASGISGNTQNLITTTSFRLRLLGGSGMGIRFDWLEGFLWPVLGLGKN